MTAEQLAVDEKVIRINSDDYYLYSAVDPETNEILHGRLFFDDNKTDDAMVSGRALSTLPAY